MKKKLLTAAVLVFILLTGMLTLAACETKDTHKGVQTITITTAEELLAIAGNVGTDYDQTAYVLANDIDLAGTTWTPIGTGYDTAFCSTFDGGGHTVYNVSLSVESAETVAETSTYFGFFGFTRNATMRNLEIRIDYDLGYTSETTYAGGLIAYAFGNTLLENVTVDGTIDLTLATDNKNMHLYTGGVLAASNGSLTMKSTVSGVNLQAGKLEGTSSLGTLEELSRLHTVYAGGVAGYIRTVDLSPSNTQDNVLEDITFEGGITVYADRLNAGGAIGSLYNSSLTQDVTVSEDVTLLFDSFYRANAGGVIGYADNTAISNAQCRAHSIELIFSKTIETNKILNVGGLVGYAANNSDISGSSVDTLMVLSPETDYAGGLAGVLAGSSLTDCTAYGRYIVKYHDTGKLLDVFGNQLKKNGKFEIDTGKPAGDITKVTMYRWASVAGKLFGSASLAEIDTAFEAVYAVTSVKIRSVKAMEEKDENGKTQFEYFTSTVDAATITFRGDKTVEYLKNPGTYDGTAVFAQD